MSSPSPPSTAQTRTHIPTLQAYNSWSTTYDSDNNFLQALDTYILSSSLLAHFLSLLPQSPTILDLGCGTGRNTIPLLSVRDATIIGLDFSPGMLTVAKERCERAWNALSEGGKVKAREWKVQQWDFFHNSSTPFFSSAPVSFKPDDRDDDADAIISTLVLEHIPLSTFFSACASLLKPGGKLLVTNMHAEMGKVSQAGYTDVATGEKVFAGTSFAHEVEEVLDEARRWGFEIEGNVMERRVRSEDSELLGERARKWVDLGVKVWFGIVFVRNEETRQ
ncbi:MAG: hypothetical protein Q9190_005700 [Brigantiaea leucoxantha]